MKDFEFKQNLRELLLDSGAAMWGTDQWYIFDKSYVGKNTVWVKLNISPKRQTSFDFGIGKSLIKTYIYLCDLEAAIIKHFNSQNINFFDV